MNTLSDSPKPPAFDTSKLILPSPAEWGQMLRQDGSARTGIEYDLSCLKTQATFIPTRTDDLKPGLAALIGEEATWAWVGVLPGDHPAYPGQDIWKANDGRFGGLCVPDEDLVLVTEVGATND